jgi:hypothetical protein
MISGEKLCGVGITFVEDGNGALFVKSLVAGGSAALSGQIQVLQLFCKVARLMLYVSEYYMRLSY